MKAYQRYLATTALGSVLISTVASAADFNIPAGDLRSALHSYMAQSGRQLMFSDDAIGNIQTHGVKGNYSDDDALARVLQSTGFVTKRAGSGAIGILPRQSSSSAEEVQPLQLAQATTSHAAERQ